jgi:DNA-binding protein HU-beta
MNKADLIERMAADAGITKTAAAAALESLLSNVTRTLKRNKKVTLVGFGSFEVSKRKARAGRNPQTGETIHIKARKVPKFTAGKGLKDAVS